MSKREVSFNTVGYRQVDKAELDSQQWMFMFLDLQSGFKDNRAMKAIVIDQMKLNPGDSVIDVGCGLGDDVRALAEIVGPNGHVVGWDLSDLFLTEAERRSDGDDLPVSWHQGDVHNLSFEDNIFDAARSERTFMHLEDPKKAIAELIRVVRPGGRIVILEPDHRTAVQITSKPDMMAKLNEYQATINPEGDHIGSRLPIVFDECGLTDIDIIPHLLVVDGGQANEVREATVNDAPPWYSAARDQGFLTPEEYEELRDDLIHLIDNGLHRNVITNFIVAGTVAD